MTPHILVQNGLPGTTKGAGASRSGTRSSNRHPCPACGRSKDGDCEIKADGLIYCHRGKSHYPPDGLRPGDVHNGLAYLGESTLGRAMFRPDQPRDKPVTRRQIAAQTRQPAPAPAKFTGPITLARLTQQLQPVSSPYSYGPGQRIIRVDASGKKNFFCQHLNDQGSWVSGAGPDPWPLFAQDSLLTAAGWILEVEGEKCAGIAQAAGIVATTQPGCAHKVAQIIARYQTLKNAGVAGIAYLADNDQTGKQRAKKAKEAAAAVGLPLVVLPAVEVWPGLPSGGSIDDAPGTPAEQIAAIESGLAAAAEETNTDLLAAAPVVVPSGWIPSNKGELKRSKFKVGDICQLLRNSLGKQLAFNKLTLSPEYNGTAMHEEEIVNLYCFLSEHGYEVGKEATSDALLTIAREQSFHPVKQYLNAVEADQAVQAIDLDTIAKDYLGAVEPLAAAMLRATLIGAVKRAIEPGCQFDVVCVLKGPQGTLKSSFWATLASPAWFTSTMPQSDKDALLNIHSCWIFELAELESITNSRDAGALKNLITTRSDLYRPPYGRAASPHPRASVFVGSVNNDTFLRDETGSRRYWVIEPTRKPDLKKLQANRDAIWKAAVLAYRAGEMPMLSDEHQAISDAQNGSYEAEDPWLAVVSKWAGLGRNHFDTTEAIIGAGLRDSKQIGTGDARRAADCLKRLGFEQDKSQTRQNGKRGKRLWRKPAAQMAQIGSDENGLSDPHKKPVATTDLPLLDQMAQIKSHIGTGKREAPPPPPSTTSYGVVLSEPSDPHHQTLCAGSAFRAQMTSDLSEVSEPHLSHTHPLEEKPWHMEAIALSRDGLLPAKIALQLDPDGRLHINGRKVLELLKAREVE